eukprot:UN05745
MSLLSKLQDHVGNVTWTSRLCIIGITSVFKIAELTWYQQPAKNDKIHAKSSMDTSRILMTCRMAMTTGIFGYCYLYKYPSVKDKELTSIEKIAIGVSIFGYLLRNYCKYILGKHFTYAISIQSEHKVIDNGPYCIVRHPGYIGAILSSIGTAVWLENIMYWFVTINHLRFVSTRIQYEEEMLEENLGTDYKQYKDKVQYKLIPFIYLIAKK